MVFLFLVCFLRQASPEPCFEISVQRQIHGFHHFLVAGNSISMLFSSAWMRSILLRASSKVMEGFAFGLLIPWRGRGRGFCFPS